MSYYAYAGLAGLQIASGLQQAEMIQMSADIQRSVSEMNARFAEIDAYKMEIASESEIAAYQPVIDQTIGEQRVAFAAQDVDVNFGTAAEIQEETRLTGFLNQLKMRQEGRAKAMGMRMEASNLRLGGEMGAAQATMNAYGARASGYLSAAATGLNAYARNK